MNDQTLAQNMFNPLPWEIAVLLIVFSDEITRVERGQGMGGGVFARRGRSLAAGFRETV